MATTSSNDWQSVPSKKQVSSRFRSVHSFDRVFSFPYFMMTHSHLTKKYSTHARQRHPLVEDTEELNPEEEERPEDRVRSVPAEPPPEEERDTNTEISMIRKVLKETEVTNVMDNGLSWKKSRERNVHKRSRCEAENRRHHRGAGRILGEQN